MNFDQLFWAGFACISVPILVLAVYNNWKGTKPISDK